MNRGLIVAAAILHDIGKLRELEYHPVEARYTKEGTLIGHVLMGRDMVREAAAKIEGFPEELLLCLEHAILSHHGKREFGAPVAPATLEALIVSFVDDLDAKVNMVAQKVDGSAERRGVHRQDLRAWKTGSSTAVCRQRTAARRCPEPCGLWGTAGRIARPALTNGEPPPWRLRRGRG